MHLLPEIDLCSLNEEMMLSTLSLPPQRIVPGCLTGSKGLIR